VDGIRWDLGKFVCVLHKVEGDGVLKGSVGGDWAGVCVEDRTYRDGNKATHT
jgi:hypothetical protein